MNVNFAVKYEAPQEVDYMGVSYRLDNLKIRIQTAASAIFECSFGRDVGFQGCFTVKKEDLLSIEVILEASKEVEEGYEFIDVKGEEMMRYAKSISLGLCKMPEFRAGVKYAITIIESQGNHWAHFSLFAPSALQPRAIKFPVENGGEFDDSDQTSKDELGAGHQIIEFCSLM